ncbi:MAG: cytochrome P450 [Pirellulales bacterium]|nr:cytochrome P450 [Pirellulales bacterium]
MIRAHAIAGVPRHVAPISYLAESPLREMLALERTYGDYVCWQDDETRLYFAFGPAANKQVLCDTDTFHACFCPLRGPKNSAQRRVTHGLLSMNGEQHKQHRRVLSVPFQRPALAEYQPAFADTARQMLDEWQTGEVRDLAADMNRLLLAITGKLLFGIDDDGMAIEMAELLEQYMEASHALGMAAVGWHPRATQQYDHLLSLAEEVEARMRQLIAARRERGYRDDSFLSVLLRMQGQEGHELSDDELIGHATLLFGAAQSTTAYTLTWTLALAALHPELLAEVLPEIDQIAGDRPLSLGALNSVPLLDQFIKESMRILPASVYLQRVVMQPTELGPFQLPVGSTVVISQWVSHRQQRIFAEPERFWPDRWKTSQAVPYSYMPFGMGPRLCIGNVWATAILKTVLAMIWQRFAPELCSDQSVDLQVKATMLAPGHQVKMRLHARDRGAVPRIPAGNLADFVDLSALQ